MTKSELRKVYLATRRRLSTAEHAELSEKICKEVFVHLDIANLTAIHCFISLPHFGEPGTRPILEAIWTRYPTIKTFAPKIDLETMSMASIRFGPESRLVENEWRVPEPVEGETAGPEEIDLVLVPLVCFDLRGYRVGYGKGFYDRFLSACRPDCMKVGLSFFPPVEKIDDIHNGDIPLDLCLTPDEVFRFETF